jgi:hypothetical protein
VASQHPYAAEFIGEPHVFSVTMDNVAEVDSVIQAALKAVNEGKVGVLVSVFNVTVLLHNVTTTLTFIYEADVCYAACEGNRFATCVWNAGKAIHAV